MKNNINKPTLVKSWFNLIHALENAKNELEEFGSVEATKEIDDIIKQEKLHINLQ